jgi:hypothetical protein
MVDFELLYTTELRRMDPATPKLGVACSGIATVRRLRSLHTGSALPHVYGPWGT